MTNTQELTNPIYSEIENRFKAMYNLYLKTVLQQKINCFWKHSQDPVDYYHCFDRSQRKILKDLKLMREWQQNSKDELTICKYECKKQGEQSGDCIAKCQNEMKKYLHEVYEGYYRERLGKRQEFKGLLQKCQMKR